MFNSKTTAGMITDKLLEQVKQEEQHYPSLKELSHADLSFWVDHVGLTHFQGTIMVHALEGREVKKADYGASAGSASALGATFKTPAADLPGFSMPNSTPAVLHHSACVNHSLID